MILRLTGAAVRAMIVAILVMLPAFLLTGITQSGLEFTRIVATIAAVFVIYEYGFATPSVIEFRYAAPYNRIRFMLLLALVLTPAYLISIVLDGQALSGTLGHTIFALMDYTYSPVTIVAKTLSGNDAALREAIGQAIAFNVMISLACVFAFCVAVFTNILRFGDDGFNLWLNMPTYKSYDVSSLQERLINSAFASMLIACLIPLFGPTAVDVSVVWFSTDGVLAPIAIAWLIAIWTYLPAIYLMRAAALTKVAMTRGDKGHWIPV